MSVRVALLSRDQIDRLPERAREVVEYRKSGLSLNHIQGCPLDCAYCIRHTYGLWDQRVPRALMSDAEAVEELVNHRYFQPHVTPVQVFNRATDPFLPAVRPHTFAVLEDLDTRGLTNHVLVITRHQMKPDDIDRLNRLQHVKVTLLFTYSGIDNKEIEPYPSRIAAGSLMLMSAPRERRYRTVLYWRPLVPGLNDSLEHLDAAYELSKHADATVFTGLFYRDEIAEYYKANNLPEPYDETARRKITRYRVRRRYRKWRAPCLTPAVSWSWTSRSERPSCLDSPRSNRATTSNTHSGSRYTMFAIPTATGGMVGRTSDGRTVSKMADWTNLTYVVVDVEGNGQQPPDLVELAAVPIVGGVVGEPMSWLVKPPRPIKYFATRIHGLTNNDVDGAPSFAEISGQVLHSLNAPALVAHNAHVDVGVLQRHLGDWGCPEVFDTLKLAKRFVPNQMSYKLGSLVEAFKLAEGLPDGLSLHRATYDALVAARLFVLLATKAATLEELRGQGSGGGKDEAPALF